MKNRGLSLLLVLMIVLTLLPIGALATKSDNIKQFNRYVCIGDGIAAGCELDNNNVRGFEIVPNAYHSHVANATGATVASLAHTGMRTVEVRWLLDDAYSASEEAKSLRAMYFNGLHDILYWMDMKKNDPYNPDIARYANEDSEYYICPNTRATLEPYCSYGAFGFKEYFRQNIAKADLCTVALGLNDIFLYAMKQTAAELNNPSANLITEVTEFLRYMNIGQNAFKTNWAPMINKIKEYNPNIEIVVVGMYNPFNKVKAFSSAELVPIGRAADVMVASLNNYMNQQAESLGYKYADVTQIPINSADSFEYPFLFEEIINACCPTAEGHNYIADQIIVQLKHRDPTPTPTSTPAPSPTPIQANPFTDISVGQYYYDPVIWAVSQVPQITTGTTATTFSPNAICTRGQIVTFLWRAFGCPEPAATSNPFQDIKVDAYYCKAVLWAVEQGITTGTDQTHFSPNANCTRAQAVTFLWRAAGKPATTLSVYDDPIVYITASGNGTAYHRSTCSTLQNSSIVGIPLSEALARGYTPCKRCKPDSAPSTPDPTPTPTPTPQRETVGGFSDVFADQYFANAVLWAVRNAITNGIDATHFAPDNPCTRGQIVTFLYRDMK